MDYRKVMTIVICASCVMFLSCNNKGNVTKEEYDDILEEYRILKEEQKNTLARNQELNELVDQVFNSLNSISGRTFVLGRDIEKNSKKENLKRAEAIASDIQAIKQKLERTVEDGNLDESSRIVVEKLQSAIHQKEVEISQLNQLIVSQKAQITQLDQKVSNLDTELGKTNAQLNNTNAQLQATESKLRTAEINSWIQAGDELLNTANLLPDVKGHGNMKEIKQAKLKIILRAKDCYKRAYELGGSSATSKMSEADRLYRLAN